MTTTKAITRTVEVGQEDVDVAIEYTISGNYLTLRNAENLSPPEYPEVTINKVTRKDNGQEIHPDDIWPTLGHVNDFTQEVIDDAVDCASYATDY